MGWMLIKETNPPAFVGVIRGMIVNRAFINTSKCKTHSITWMQDRWVHVWAWKRIHNGGISLMFEFNFRPTKCSTIKRQIERKIKNLIKEKNAGYRNANAIHRHWNRVGAMTHEINGVIQHLKSTILGLKNKAMVDPMKYKETPEYKTLSEILNVVRRNHHG